MSLIDPDKVAAIVRSVAEGEILTRFGVLGSADIIEKRPGNAGNLVTTADIEAEKILTRELQILFPGTVAIGEEISESYSEIVGTIVLKVSCSCDLTVNRKELNINYIIHLL